MRKSFLHSAINQGIEGESTMDFDVEELLSLIKSPGIKQKIKRKEVWKNL